MNGELLNKETAKVTQFLDKHHIVYEKEFEIYPGMNCFLLMDINQIPWKNEYEEQWDSDNPACIYVNDSGCIFFGKQPGHQCDSSHDWEDLTNFYEPENLNLDKYHTFTKEGNAKDIIDALIVEDIVKTNNIIVISGIPYLYENGSFELDEDGCKTKDIIKNYIYKHLVNTQRINRVYSLLLIEVSINKSIEEVNNFPKTWVNFKNGMYDAAAKVWHEHDIKYYSINQIPHEYDASYIIPEDSAVLNCLKEKFPDPEDREMYLQYCGYSLTTDTHLQKFLMLYGEGNTGKSTLIRLHDTLIGKKNKSSLSLQDLNKRFYPTCLFGKLMNTCADIPSETMQTVDIIKKITGEDTIIGEYKGGKIFEFTSYAKLLFSANRVPLSYDDKTNAYYRRLLILKVDRGEYIPHLEEELMKDMQTYIHLCVDALNRMYCNRGMILESNNSKQAVEELYKQTDTVHSFILDKCEKGKGLSVKRCDLYEAYEDYCEEEDRTALTKHNFLTNLNDKGYQTKKVDGIYYINRLALISEIPFD